MANQRSMSQRLRDVLYLVWEYKHSTEMDFDTYYNKSMEAIIKKVKVNLPETRYDEPAD